MSTYLSLHYHLIFSTKNRQRLISNKWDDRLHKYMGGTVKGLDGIPQQIGGVADHVHFAGRPQGNALTLRFHARAQEGKLHMGS